MVHWTLVGQRLDNGNAPPAGNDNDGHSSDDEPPSDGSGSDDDDSDSVDGSQQSTSHNAFTFTAAVYNSSTDEDEARRDTEFYGYMGQYYF